MPLVKVSRYIEGKINILSRLMGIIAISVLVAMMLFTVLNVVMRAFFNRPIPGDVGLVEVGMVCVGFLSLGWCAVKGMHISVDLVVSFLPRRVRAVFNSFGYLVALGIFLLIAWRSFLEGIANRELHNLSATLAFPIFPFYWVTALGYAVLCLATLHRPRFTEASRRPRVSTSRGISMSPPVECSGTLRSSS
ncbi:MAG: TRAP transporter small permease [Deltaproteobacteria bacterium]|nr:TRAP transporter small permease [Deltaproteobacteria bacterium]